jgi:large subunit ribosomal protein L29
MPRNVRELRELGDAELLERLESHKEELFNLRFQLATGQLDNPMRIKQVRHDVARILTILREREPARQLEEEIARVDQEALARAREGRAEAGGERRGLIRRRPKAVEAAVGSDSEHEGVEAEGEAESELAAGAEPAEAPEEGS